MQADRTNSSSNNTGHTPGTLQLLTASIVLGFDGPNRDESTSESKGFLDLEQSILDHGANDVPVKVQRAILEDGSSKYKLIKGMQRLDICKKHGIPVLAEVIDRHITDIELLGERIRENMLRTPYSPVELGRILLAALDAKVFKNQSRLAQALRLDTGIVSKSISLASQPPEVHAAFRSIHDISYYMATELKAAIVANRDAVIKMAIEIRRQQDISDPKIIFKKLIGAALPKDQRIKTPKDGNGLEDVNAKISPNDSPPALIHSLTCDGKSIGSIQQSEDGHVQIEISPKLDAIQYELLCEIIQEAIASIGIKNDVASDIDLVV